METALAAQEGGGQHFARRIAQPRFDANTGVIPSALPYAASACLLSPVREEPLHATDRRQANGTPNAPCDRLGHRLPTALHTGIPRFAPISVAPTEAPMGQDKGSSG